jgi:DNA replicative helicase MCM subunit Mcm2 (Cdc46/Mcm family)
MKKNKMKRESRLQIYENLWKNVDKKIEYNKSKNKIILNYNQLTQKEKNLLKKEPDFFIRGCRVAVKKNVFPTEDFEFKNLKLKTIKPENISAIHIDELIAVKGKIIEIGSIEPLCLQLSYECPSCGRVIHVFEPGMYLKKPRNCDCGRKGSSFRLLSKLLIDSQVLELEHTKPMPLLLTNNSVSNKFKIGQDITVVGIVKANPYTYKRRKTRHYKYEIDGIMIKK